MKKSNPHIYLFLLLVILLTVPLATAWYSPPSGNYTTRFKINCESINDGVPLVVNGSSGWTHAGYTQTIWTICAGPATYLYYNSTASVYVVANETNALPMEIEDGNGSNSADFHNLWRNYSNVYHLAGNAITSTAVGNNGTVWGTPNYTRSIIGKDLEFDGGTIKVSIYRAFNTISNNIGTGTYLVFLKSRANGTGDAYGQNKNIMGEGWGYYLSPFGIKAGGIIDFKKYHRYPTESLGPLVNSTDIAPYNASILVGYTWSNTSGTESLIFNNSFQANVTGYDMDLDGSGRDQFFIGVGSDNSSGYFNGTIGEVRISPNTTNPETLNMIYKNFIGALGFGNLNGTEETATSPPPEIALLNKTPSNISIGNAYTGANFSYNFSNITGMSNIFLNYTVTSNSNNCFIIYNQTCISSYNTSRFLYNTSVSAMENLFRLYDTDYYAGDYNINQTLMIATSHNVYNLTNSNKLLKIEFLNLTNSTHYNFFEIMMNTTSPTAVFYCNETYTTGAPESSAYCGQIGTINSTIYNHTHTSNSKHNILTIPLNITAGKIGAIYLTARSYFIIKGTNTGAAQIGTINSLSRTDAIQTSSNDGTTYSSETFTPDSHIHQMNADSTLLYQACENKTGNITCDTLYNDLIDDSPAPPSSVSFTNPTAENQNVSNQLNITYTASLPSSNATVIGYYKLELLYSDLSTAITLKANNSLALFWMFDIFNYTLNLGTYYVKVTTYDSLGSYAIAISNPINITADKKVYVIARDIITNATLTTYGVNFTDPVKGGNFAYNTGSTLLTAYLQKNQTYNMSLSATGYATSTSTQTLTNNASENITLWAYTSNSVYVHIYDENTGALITQNITINIDGSVISYTNYTSTGVFYQDGLDADNYTFKFQGANYTLKTYSVTVANGSTQNLDAYLAGTTFPVTFTVQNDQTGELVEDAAMTMERQINGTYTVVESKNTDLTGRAQFSYVSGVKYKFTVIKTNYSTKVFYLDPVLFSTYTVALTPSTTTTFLSDYSDVSITFYPKTFYNNMTNNFTFIISSPYGTLVNYTVNLSVKGNWSAYNGNNANGESIYLAILIDSAQLYQKVNLSYDYRTVGAGNKHYFFQYEILGTGAMNQTMISIKNNQFGLGLFEKSFLVIIVCVMIAGFAYMLVGVGGALAAGLLVQGVAVYLGFLPVSSFIIGAFVGIALIVASSMGGNR